ncbi:hypothetical protein BJ742DRAFT_779529 [Cladochytrium replicatum]|nr:hypothetical protein BJ742DRAFT_779529 [Cladochytrium replicatum]
MASKQPAAAAVAAATAKAQKLKSPLNAKRPQVQGEPIPGFVIFKILTFSVLLVVVPIGSYFYTVDRWFGGNQTYSALLAAVLANVVVAGYVVAAFLETDEKEATSSKIPQKKEDRAEQKSEEVVTGKADGVSTVRQRAVAKTPIREQHTDL